MNYTEKNRLIDRLCGVGLMLIFVEIFLAVAKDGFWSFKYILKMPTILNVTGAIFLAIGICILIYAYKKGDGWKAGFGIEFIIIAFVSVILPHTYIDFPYPFNLLNKIFPFAFLAYYIVKAIVVIVKANKKKR